MVILFVTKYIIKGINTFVKFFIFLGYNEKEWGIFWDPVTKKCRYTHKGLSSVRNRLI